MDVTKDNFLQVLPGFEAALQGCEFVAIDFEMSGIRTPGQAERPTHGDTPQERYAKMVPVASRYNIVQMGVCIFSKSDDKTSLIARPYNFFTFPAEGDDVVLSISAINFLKKNEMNFGKWIQEGVSYTNAEGEALLVKKLEEKRRWDREKAKAAAADAVGWGADKKRRIKLSNDSDIAFMKTSMEKVKAWVEGGGEGEGSSKELILRCSNSFLRKVLYEAIEDAYPPPILSTETNDENNDVAVLRLTAEDKKAREDEQLAAKVGMRGVFKALGACGTPIVFHSGVYDLMFMMATFNEKLPAKLTEFKKQVAECFPEGGREGGRVFDTKFVSTREDLLGKSLRADLELKDLYRMLVVEGEGGREGGVARVVLAEGFEKYKGGGEGGKGGFEHEAGYDAFLTGAIFDKMQAMLREGGKEGGVEEVVNKLHLYPSQFVLNLDGEDGLVWRKEGQMIFHLAWEKEVGKGLKNPQLMKLFPGEVGKASTILWIDDLGAFAVVEGGGEGVGEEEVVAAVRGPAEAVGVRVRTLGEWVCGRKKAEEEEEKEEEGKEGGEGGQ